MSNVCWKQSVEGIGANCHQHMEWTPQRTCKLYRTRSQEGLLNSRTQFASSVAIPRVLVVIEMEKAWQLAHACKTKEKKDMI